MLTAIMDLDTSICHSFCSAASAIHVAWLSYRGHCARSSVKASVQSLTLASKPCEIYNNNSLLNPDMRFGGA